MQRDDAPTRRKQLNSGFTTLELLITVLIVGILASISIPIYRDVIQQAYIAEADAGLGMIRTTLRARLMHSVNTDWNDLAGRYTAGLLLRVTDISELNLQPGDFGGKYFDHNAYRMTELTGTTFTVQVIGDSSSAQSAVNVRTLVRQIDQAGNLTTVE
ncbi:MAG: prepilin-type N-terminal cleavage/methylation domain-containing protein [candidate division Zixibacteria bacterium]|nr:prepilin-type N-terminal cleavage/methylation domain-containing protein [candidate division Zixibacteria bacterium]